MGKNCEKIKFLKKQSESVRRKRIQRWMNELRKMIEEDCTLTDQSNVKLDKIDLLEYAIRQLQLFNSSFQQGYENCRTEIVTCLSERNQKSPFGNKNTSDILLMMNKLNKENHHWINMKVLNEFSSGADVNQKRDVLVKLRQKIIENKRKKCIKQKMNIYNDGAQVDDDVWRPW